VSIKPELKIVHISPDISQDNLDVIADLVEHVQSGNVVGLAVTWTLRDGSVGVAFNTGHQGGLAMIGAVSALESKIKRGIGL
jgi:hypothetical protein